MNKCIFIGYTTKDVELGVASNGAKVARFTIAVKGYKADEADFINIVVWNGVAESCSKYIKKGDKVAVTGSLHNRSYEKDGITRYISEVVASEVEFLNNRPKEDMSPVDDEDVPF